MPSATDIDKCENMVQYTITYLLQEIFFNRWTENVH